MGTPDQPVKGPLAALIELLEEERRTLLGGTPEQINAVTQRKLLLADKVERDCRGPGIARPEPAILQQLARYNQENAVICSAMLRHLTAALDKLRRYDLHRSYNPDGSEQSPARQHALGAA
jgi:flagellar biosynthesis/type III secretory pathway chaperone